MYAISASKAPRTSAPFSEGTSAGRYVFVSAQPPVDPTTGAVVGGSLQDMASQCISNVEAVLCELDLTLAEVTKVTVLLAGTDDFAAADAACEERFPRPMPACSRMQVTSLPGGAPIAIEAIACR
mgnify:CR=1 FL=1